MGHKVLGDEAEDTNALSRKTQLTIHIGNHEDSIWCQLTLIGASTLCSNAKDSGKG